MKRFPLLLLLAVAALPVAAQDPAADDVGRLVPDPAVRYGTLANGMRYALMSNDTPPETASIRLTIDVGSLMEAEDQRGLAHFVEHMAFNGTRNVDEGEMVRMLERLGLAFGPDTNASTGYEHTSYQLELPRVDVETLDSALFLLREVASNVLFEAEAIDRERGVVASELRAANTPGYRASRDQLLFLLPETRFVERPVGGVIEVIEGADRERFIDLYQRYYRPGKATLVVVGDLDMAVLEDHIEKHFGGWQVDGRAGERPAPDTLGPRSAAARVYQEAGIANRLSVSVIGPWEDQPDSVASRRQALVRGLAYAILNRRLQTLARASDAPILGGGFGRSELKGTAFVASANVNLQPDRWPAGLALIEQELRRAISHGFTRAELDEQLANIRTALENAVAAAATRSTPGLANLIAGSLAAEQVMTHPRDNLERFDRQAPTIALAQLRETLAVDWAGDVLIHLTTSESVGDNIEAALLDAWVQSRAVAVLPPRDNGAESFAYGDFGQPGAVVERSTIEDLGIERVRFANGVRLNIKQTDFRDNEILATMRVGIGKADLPEALVGLDILINSSFVAGGLEAHSADELQRLLAGRVVSARAGISEAALGFSGATTPADLLLQLDLWAALLSAPGFRDESYGQFRRLVDGMYQTIETTPSGVLQRDLPRLLRGGDKRYGIPPRSVLEDRTVAEMKAFLVPALEHAPIEVAVVGSVLPEQVIDAVASTLGALPERTPMEAFSAVAGPVFPTGEAITLRHSGADDQAIVAIFWPTSDGLDDARREQLGLLERVAQLRVTDEVRERLGASYSPSVSGAASRRYRGYGFMGVQSRVEPSEVDRMVKVLSGVLESLATQPITDDELLRARQPVLEQLETGLESNGYWLGLLSTAQSRPEVLDSHRRARSLIQAVSTDELASLAAQHLRAERRYVVKAVPGLRD